MRNMSFLYTMDQIREGVKTETIRKGWGFLLPGMRLMACEKCMGIPRGGKIIKIRPIEIVQIDLISICDVWIKIENVIAEGFPELTVYEFIQNILVEKCGLKKHQFANRITFKYV